MRTLLKSDNTEAQIEPTICFGKQNEDKIRESVKANAPLTTKMSCVGRRDGKGLACMAGRRARGMCGKA